MFYLQAPRAIGDPHLRHWNVSIGHAVSDDLSRWDVVADALAPGPAGDWDDAATWTGSVVRADDGVWWMLYTGAATRENALVQRIGAATSTDLLTWRRHPANPLVEADARWYELLDLDVWHDQAWRDPWVFRDPAGDGWHMLVTARCNDAIPDDRGVIGHATSPDLAHWEVRPPLTAPAGFGQLEVSQVEVVDGQALLLFSIDPMHVSDLRRSAAGAGLHAGTYVVPGGSLLGPFDVGRDAALLPYRSLYSGRLVPGMDGKWQLVGFLNEEHDAFIGEIADPIPFRMPAGAS